jgi:hypothetical protein
MTRSAISQATLKRAMKTATALGQAVTGIVLRPDGAYELRLTHPDASARDESEPPANLWDDALAIR